MKLFRFIEDQLLRFLQRRCKHPSGMVAADILEGCGEPLYIPYCNRCGAIRPEQRVEFSRRPFAPIPASWRLPDPNLWRGVVFLAFLSLPLAAQPTPVPAPNVTVTIADQGAAPMQLITGVKVATATLLDATSCNETAGDESVDNSMVYQRINALTTQNLTLYDSQVVSRVLTVFQDKNLYAKLFRAGVAASTVGVILTTALKLNPALSLSLAIAPQIYAAVLPVVHSPEDLQALIADIVPQNTGGKLAGHTCRSGLVIARTTAPVKTEVIAVQ